MEPFKPSEPVKTSRIRHWVLLAVLGLGFFMLISLIRLFLLDGDAKTLRDGLTEPGEYRLKTRVQLSLGPVATGITRFFVSRAANLRDEQRIMLSLVHKLSVGVYEFPGETKAQNKAFEHLADLDRKMAARGWVRMLAMHERQDCVVMYVPEKPSSDLETQVCVAVINGQHLVVASAWADLEPLAQLVRDHKGDLLRCRDFGR